MIFPEIFDGHVMGFFTDRELGLAVQGLTGRRVYMPRQEHTDKVVVLDSGLTPKVADAVVSDRDDIMLGVGTADCVPILLYDRVGGVSAAVHAGWKGTAKGILKKTLKVMQDKFGTNPRHILVAMGPAIKWCCYVVGDDVLEAVKKQTGDGEYFMVKDGQNCLDLQTANKFQGLSVGIKDSNISIIEECTYCHPDTYHSYRYDKSDKGRQGGFIGLP